ncbi:hypothetical protein [Agrobacterium tumefaciens]|nr:hypothetical protein [Agrobacterium tumefaciens]MDS7597170.1 hypothetical protein [Agrobacterium tumefaciens]
MTTVLTALLALISAMFVASMISAVGEMRRDGEKLKAAIKRNRAF